MLKSAIETTTRREGRNGLIGRGKGRHKPLSMLARCLGTGAALLPRLQLCRPLPLSAIAGYDLLAPVLRQVHRIR